MTATLNGLQCTSADVTVPIGGAMWGRLVLADATEAPAIGSAAELVIAGVTLACTITDSGERGGVFAVEVTGGKAGWAKPPPAPKAYRNDAGQLLSEVVSTLGEAVGETVALASGVDRSLGSWVAVPGGPEAPSAGAILSQLCGLPEGATRIPWYVDTSGVTRLGPRLPLGEVEATEVDADERRAWVAYAEEDASGLLPGATIGGVGIAELRIEASPGRLREVCTLLDTGPARSHTIAARMLSWVLDIVRPLVMWRGVYTYRITRRNIERFDAVPVTSRIAPALAGLRYWPGVAGASTHAKTGARCLIAFADGNPNAPVIVGWMPRDLDKGQPDQVVIDATEVLLGKDATRGIARANDTVTVLLPPGTFTGLLGTPPATTPITGMIVWAGQTMGSITTFSAKGKSE